ncbi:Flp family type IVb pilin [Nocardioides hwasunensis]|uniref:Flp family type IVb pilin n=1 Tax=Nocardioides hwasunensis TaxID=397258 RepID=A0ABR8MC11_9ACTN|nr:Flp family type IVb pilin [Nocardioides hwasunensis]MBD3913398.1 Flp family type IVb pilin [Nocardioides hwasunensis]
MIEFLTIMLNARRDEEKGATAVEYGLMVALIAIVIIAAVTLLGGNLSSLFNNVSSSIGTGSTN